MPLVLTEDQELLAKTAADFVAQNSPVARVRALRDANDPDLFSRPLWKQMAELGWVGIPFPESLGGAGMGLAELAVVLEELGKNLAPEPFLSTVLLAGSVLQLAGSEAQQKRWLEPAVRGEAFIALAQQERGSRFDLHCVATRAEARGNRVLDGGAADAIAVVARTAGAEDDHRGITLFLVANDTPGLRVLRQSRVDSRGAALVQLDGCEIGADALIGAPGEGLPVLEAAVDRATVGLCAEMLGSMSEAFERTLDYLKHRIQFGVPIGSFQALKHRAAELFIQIELCRSAVMAAARAVDAGSAEAAKLVSLAKARCSDAAILVANEAIQMHGGIGMTDEHEIGFYLKRARVAELTLGDGAWHRARWASLAGY